MKAKYIFEKLTNFTEDSDAIKDMGIGLKPDEVSQNFAIAFKKEFDQVIYYDECGSDFDLKHGDVYRVGEESFEDASHPIFKLFAGEHYELDFVTNTAAANHIVKGATWGWFYYTKGTANYLKDIYEFDDVIKEICRLTDINNNRVKMRIKRYKGYVTFLKKLEKYT